MGNFKWRNTHVLGVPQRKIEKISEKIMASDFLNMMKTINPQIQEAQ